MRSLIDLEEFKQDEAFASVQRWTRGVDLFTKEWIFIPVCYAMHWSLAIIVNAPELFKRIELIDARLRKFTGVHKPGSLDTVPNLPGEDDMKDVKIDEEEDVEEKDVEEADEAEKKHKDEKSH